MFCNNGYLTDFSKSNLLIFIFLYIIYLFTSPILLVGIITVGIIICDGHRRIFEIPKHLLREIGQHPLKIFSVN